MATTTIGELQILITAKDAASQIINQVNQQQAGLGKTIAGTAGGFMLAEAAQKGFNAAMQFGIGNAMGFEQAMSNVKAVTNATAGEQDKLKQAALDAGQATVFTAREAATATAELARAGLNTSDILGGALRGSLDLAAAGQMDLADAAIISAQAMNAFGLEGSDVGHIADVLAAGANKSAADVKQLGDALRQSALMANNTGISLETTVGILAAFADRALIGSDAGTSLKTMLGRLTPDSEKAAKTMRDLGIWAYDASGQFVGLAQFAGQLQEKMSGLTPEARNAALEIMFGSDAVRGATVLYELGAEGVQEYTAAVNDVGAAQRMAETQTDNLAGDVERLKGSMETLGIELGTRAIPMLAGVAQGAEAMVDGFGKLPDSTQNIVAMGLAAGVAGPKLVSLATAIGSASAASLVALGPIAAFTAAVIGLDIATEKMAGDSLLTILAGKGGDAARANAALAEWNAQVTAAGPNIDKASLALRMLADVTAEAGGSTADLREGVGLLEIALKPWDGSMKRGADRTKELEERVEVLGAQMVLSGANVFALKNAYDALPPALRDNFDSVTEVVRAYEAFTAQVSQGSDELDRLAVKEQLVAFATEDLATEQESATPILDAYVAKMGEGKTAADNLKASITGLQNAFATTNPVVVSLNAQHAKLTEELEDLKDKGEDATQADLDRIAVIEDQLLPAIDKEIKGYADNQEAVEGMSGAVTTLLGPAGYGALLEVMGKLKVPQEDQVYVTGQIADAYDLLVTDNIPGAITKFGELKDQLSPEVWAPIAEAVGPELSRKIKNGLTGPEADAAVAAARQLGIDIAEGAEAGMASRMSSVVSAAASMVSQAIAAARTAAQTESPSRLTYQIGVDIAKGAELGIEKAGPDVVLRAKSVVDAVIGEWNRIYEAADVKALYDNAPDYVKRLSPAAGGDKSNVGPYHDAGPNGTIWDAAAGAYVYPWEVGSNLPDRIFDWQNSKDFGQTGGIVVNIGTVNARDESEAGTAARSIGFGLSDAIRQRGL